MNKTPKVNTKNFVTKDNIVSFSQKKEKVKTKAVPAVDQIFHLHRTIGNQAVQRLFKSGTLQAKLRIGKPGDKYEREADKIADQVMRTPEMTEYLECKGKREEPLQTKPITTQITPLVRRQVEPEEEEEPIQAKMLSTENPVLQKQEEEEEEEEELVQTKGDNSNTSVASSDVESSINSLKGSGQPLSESTRRYFEPRFGYDFSGVRVHTDGEASETAKSINAKAFTTGKDVVFSANQYSPETDSGKRLLAHELTHVVQQKNHREALHRQGGATLKKREYGKELEEYAEVLRGAMEGLGTEEEKIFEVLQKIHMRPAAIASLKKAYKNKYERTLTEDLRDEMSGSELDFALSLLGEKPPSKDVEIKPRTLREDDYTEAVNRLVDAIEGPGTVEELIYAVLVPFVGAFESIRKLKTAYKRRVKRSLEEDLESELSGDELEYALKLLHAPLKPAKGVSENILSEAERKSAPRGACTVASIKRYVRAYLDYYYLDGKLYKDAEGNLSPQGKVELKNKLKLILGDLGQRYLNGGPAGSSKEVGISIRDTLKHSNLFGKVRGWRLYKFWQIIGSADEILGRGATEALAPSGEYVVQPGDKIENIAAKFGVTVPELKEKNHDKLKPTPESENPWFLAGETIAIPPSTSPLGAKVTHPVTKKVNIKGILWDEILKPGAIIQTWSTSAAAAACKCVTGAPSLGGDCGHSFIFVEYVYSSEKSPPKDYPPSWPLYGGSGTPRDTGGEKISPGTYVVRPGENLQEIADKFDVTVGYLKTRNPNAKVGKGKRKTGEIVEWFNKGERIFVGEGGGGYPLSEIKDLYLVGMCIIDQRGYHFIPKDLSNINNTVLPDNVARVKWLAKSEVWFAAQLA
jgi:LysM repeat protein